MKNITHMISPATLRTLALAVASALSLQTGLRPAQAAEDATQAEFPYVIQTESGATELAPGDALVITSVRGNRKHLEPGGRYLATGSYTLASADSAELAWFSTSRGPGGSTPVTDDEHVNISRGSGSFQLKKTLLGDGWLHVSFYVNGRSHGGIYFGEKGFENTVLRRKDWSDFSNDSLVEKPDRKTAVTENDGITSPANLAILSYLGNPVPAPAGLDARYTPANLAAAFTTMSKKAGWRVQKLAVDNSEFPFLVYGVLAGRHELVEKEIREMKGYDYGGSVRGNTEEGATYFSLNMIPRDQYPSDRIVACDRRLMVRLQMLADSVRHSE